MSGIPDYKPGEYLNCGEGPEYSKILVLPGDRCIIKAGHSAGEIISLDEWYFMIGENKATIQNTTKSDKCKSCALNHTGCYDESCNVVQAIENVGMNLRTPSIDSLSARVYYDKYRTVRTPIASDTYIDTREIIHLSPNTTPNGMRTKTRRATMIPTLVTGSDISSEADIYDDFSGVGDSVSEAISGAISEATSGATGGATNKEPDFTVMPGVHVDSHKRKLPWYYRLFLCGMV